MHFSSVTDDIHLSWVKCTLMYALAHFVPEQVKWVYKKVSINSVQTVLSLETALSSV